MSFFKVKVQFEEDNGNKVKKVNREYIVKAVSPTDAETIINEYLKTATSPFEVKACVCTKIEDYVE